MLTIEQTILSSLIHDEKYGRKVAPYLKADYFESFTNQIIFSLTDEYIKKYNAFPSLEILQIELSNSIGLDENDFKTTKHAINEIKPSEVALDWLIDTTEKWCKNRALWLAFKKGLAIYQDKEKEAHGSIPQIMMDAIAVSFDTHIGHDFIEDSDSRYDFYHKLEKRIPFDIDYLNKITGGGLPCKSLNIIMAGTAVGKSLFMCHCAAGHLSKGYRVLYITLEMAEERIAERIDANLLDFTIPELRTLPKPTFQSRINKIKDKTHGKLIIKEYPTAGAGASHFRHLLQELKIKKNFSPDVIYVDYINICMSSRLKYGANVNSYTYVKSIAEEIRGLACEYNLPIISATQVNRKGFDSSDIDLTDTSESFGLPATADFMLALSTSEELEQLNQLMVKQLKNRYNDPNFNKRFIIGVDKSKMRLYDVESKAQNITDGPEDKPKALNRFNDFT
jgi:replicative DNA helicase